MKKKISLINIIAICLLVVLLITFFFKDVCVTSYNFLSTFGENPNVIYKKTATFFLILLVFVQAVFWLFNKKAIRIAGILLSCVTALRLPVYVYTEKIISGLLPDNSKTVNILPIGYVQIVISVVMIILNILSLIRMKKDR